jgi:hypothetical protein
MTFATMRLSAAWYPVRMVLTSHDGSQVEAHLVGYESPTADNWLLVAIRVTTPGGSGASVEPCWQTQEVRRMVVWFSAMVDGVPVHEWGGACLEANLEFKLVAASAVSVTLRANFILERGTWHPADGSPDVPDYGAYVDLELTRSDLRRVADELASELERYPPLVPERPLPSPLF